MDPSTSPPPAPRWWVRVLQRAADRLSAALQAHDAPRKPHDL